MTLWEGVFLLRGQAVENPLQLFDTHSLDFIRRTGLLPLKLPVQILMVPYVQKLSGKVSSVEFTKDLAVTQGFLYAIDARIMWHYHA